MDINCIDPCMYQREGKCTLNELPAEASQIACDMDCPYFISPHSL